MCQCNTILLHRLSSPHSLNVLGSSCMLKSTSGTEPPPPLHTHDAAPIKSKVAPQLTALQGVDYRSLARTVSSSHHQGGPLHGSPYERRYPIRHNHCLGPATYVLNLIIQTHMHALLDTN